MNFSTIADAINEKNRQHAHTRIIGIDLLRYPEKDRYDYVLRNYAHYYHNGESKFYYKNRYHAPKWRYFATGWLNDNSLFVSDSMPHFIILVDRTKLSNKYLQGYQNFSIEEKQKILDKYPKTFAYCSTAENMSGPPPKVHFIND